jgi:hypothetical protein
VQKFDNIKSQILSVLEYGNKSDSINDFIYACKSIAFSYLKTNKFSKELLCKEQITEEELSSDVIADLFAEKDGKYYLVNNYFEKDSFTKLTEEEIIAMLIVLVRSRAQQRISEIREEQGEIYYKIKKSIDSYLIRNKEEYNLVIFRDKQYIFQKIYEKIELDCQQIPEDELLNELFSKKMKNYSIPEVMRNIIEITGTQNQYCLAIEKVHCINLITQFYKKRLKDEISLRNADYFYIE